MKSDAVNQHADTSSMVVRYLLNIDGLVQGMGFRPYISQLAEQLGLAGWVANSANGLLIEAEGKQNALDNFVDTLLNKPPSLSRIDTLTSNFCPVTGETGFSIRFSSNAKMSTALVLPDIATCSDCLLEVFDVNNRRYRYPFTNCTQCGPRFSIQHRLPYDRINTTMQGFSMCSRCAAEYSDTTNRRFHAQPIACPDCGPQLSWMSASGEVLAQRDNALIQAVEALKSGSIVALKGLGGFQLITAACYESAIARLRCRKKRQHKPFALLMENIDLVEQYAVVSTLERKLLLSPQSPVVLVSRRLQTTVGLAQLAKNIAPDNSQLGIMLPCTALHHLLAHEFGAPLVATSGNLSGDAITSNNAEALRLLSGIADFFLVHDRPIANPVDDSVVRVIANRPALLRRARGYAPLPVTMQYPLPSIVGLGAHNKSAIATTVGRHVVVGPYIGDLNTPRSRKAFHNCIDRLHEFYGNETAVFACDQHPDYYSTQWASMSGQRLITVQHHVAHIVACMAENGIDGPALGIAWDGSGYGGDGTIRGGECLRINGSDVQRLVQLLPFPLPGGEKAVVEPRRSAMGLLYALLGADCLHDERCTVMHQFSENERRIMASMLSSSLNCPQTSSVGRLFDAVATIAGLASTSSYEGQAAYALESATDENLVPRQSARHYAMVLISPSMTSAGTAENTPSIQADSSLPMLLDWRPLIRGLLMDKKAGASSAEIATTFHIAMANAVLSMAEYANESRVVLSGGCFQNRYLTERVICLLRESGYTPVWHQQLPPNDGCLALGQTVYAAQILAKDKISQTTYLS